MRTIYQWHRWDQRTNVKTGERRKSGHRIRHYGLLASAGCKANIARAKELMAAPMPQVEPPSVRDTADPHAIPDYRRHARAAAAA